MPAALNEDGSEIDRVRRNLGYLGADAKEWVPSRPGTDWNVAIVGGGQNGVALAHALRRAGVGAVTVLDAAPAGRSGVWLNTARMNTLRTAPTISGPEQGNPDLSFAAWYERRNGVGSYAAVKRIAREDWGRYLHWYREVLDVPVRADTRLVGIEPDGDGLRLRLRHKGIPRTETARKVVLANGVSGAGAPGVPALFSDNLPRSLYSHTADVIDFEAFRGRTVAVIGGGASAFDAAATALEAGAQEVRMFVRRRELSRRSAARPRMFPGSFESLHFLSDDERWRLQRVILAEGASAPADSIARAVKHPRFRLHLSSPVRSAAAAGDGVALGTDGGHFDVAHVILGTGYAYDPDSAPELAGLASRIKRWSDADVVGNDDIEIRRSYPYINGEFQFSAIDPADEKHLNSVYCLTPAASPSFGTVIGDVPSLPFAIATVTRSLVRSLFLEDYDTHHRAVLSTPLDTDIDPSLYWSRVVTAPEGS